MAGKSTIAITFKLDADGKGFRMLASDAEGLKTALTSALKEADRFNASAINFNAFAGVIDQATGAINTLQGSLRDLAGAYAVQEGVETKLATAMRNTMSATDSQIQSIKDLCSAQQDLGVIGDEVQLAGAQELATYLTMTDTLKTLIPVMNDMVAQQYGLEASGESATQIATMLGKVMNGQVNALSRYGYSFDEAQAQILKFGTESQRAAVLAEVVGQSVGGMNAALAQTDSGRQKQLENTLGDIKERLGELTNAALPFVTIAASTVTALGGVTKLVMGIKTATAAMMAWNIKGTVTKVLLKALGLSMAKNASVAELLGGAMQMCSYKTLALKVAIRGLLVTSGVGAALWALSAAIDYLSGASEKAKVKEEELMRAQQEHQERLSEYRANTVSYSAAETEALKKLYDAATNDALSRAERLNALKSLQEQYPAYFTNISLEDSNIRTLSIAYQNLCADIDKASAAKAAFENKSRVAGLIQRKKYELQESENKEIALTQSLESAEEKSIERGPRGRNKKTYGTDPALQGMREGVKTQMQETKRLKGELVELQKELDFYDKEITKNQVSTPSASVKTPGAAKSAKGGAAAAKTLTEEERAAAIDVAEVMERQLNTLADYDRALDDLKVKQKYVDAETYNAIQKNVDKITEERNAHIGVSKVLTEAERADAIDVTEVINRNLASIADYDRALEDLRLKQKYATGPDAYQEIQKLIDKVAEARDDFTVVKPVEEVKAPEVNYSADTLKDINTNIDILTEKLQTATVEQAAALNQEIAMWEKEADAIKEAGKRAEVTFDTYKSGWGAIKNIDGAMTNLVDTLQGSGTAWEKIKALVDGFIGLYDGISAIVGVVKMLTAASEAHAAAKATETAATLASNTAEATAAAVAPVTAAAEVPLMAANKATTASFIELATAAYLAAHASIPFAGFGIASGFAASAAALTKSMGLMAFANGGIAYGPTLGLFAEYAGASNNPEVVAPLDKLRDLIEPSTALPSKIELTVRDGKLYGLLNTYSKKISRT